MSLVYAPFFREASPPPIPLLKDVKARDYGLSVSNDPKLPAGTLGIISVSFSGTSNPQLLGVSNNSGWTTVANVRNTSNTWQVFALYAKVFTGSEPTSFAIDFSSFYYSFVARLFYWLPGDHGVVNPATDITKQQSFGYNNANIPVNVPAINLPSSHRLMYFFGYGTTSSSFSPYPPTGHTQLFSPNGYADARDISTYPNDQTPRMVPSFTVTWNTGMNWIIVPFTVKG